MCVHFDKNKEKFLLKVSLRISKQNCLAVTSSKKTDEGYYPECVSFVSWKKLRLDNFVSRSADL